MQKSNVELRPFGDAYFQQKLVKISSDVTDALFEIHDIQSDVAEQIEKHVKEIVKNKEFKDVKIKNSTKNKISKQSYSKIASSIFILLKYIFQEIIINEILCPDEDRVYEFKLVNFMKNGYNSYFKNQFIQMFKKIKTDEKIKKQIESLVNGINKIMVSRNQPEIKDENDLLNHIINAKNRARDYAKLQIYLKMVFGEIMNMNNPEKKQIEPESESDSKTEPETSNSTNKESDHPKLDHEGFNLKKNMNKFDDEYTENKESLQSLKREKILALPPPTKDLQQQTALLAIQSSDQIEQQKQKTKEQITDKETKIQNQQENQNLDKELSEDKIKQNISNLSTKKFQKSVYLEIDYVSVENANRSLSNYLNFPLSTHHVKNLNNKQQIDEKIDLKKGNVITKSHIELPELNFNSLIVERVNILNFLEKEIIARPLKTIEYITKNKSVINHIAKNFYSKSYEIVCKTLNIGFGENNLGNKKLTSQLTLDFFVDFELYKSKNREQIKTKIQKIKIEMATKTASPEYSKFFPLFNSILCGEYMHLRIDTDYNESDPIEPVIMDKKKLDSSNLTFYTMQCALSIVEYFKKDLLIFLIQKMKTISSAIKIKDDDQIIKKVMVLYSSTLKFFLLNKNIFSKEYIIPSDVVYYIT